MSKFIGEDSNPRLLDDEFNLWIIRHSRVDSQGALYGGGLDLPTHNIKRYERDFEWLAQKLRHLPLQNTIFYTSEQRRSKETFDELAGHMQIDQDPVALWELNEQNFGALEGFNFEYLCELVKGGWRDIYDLVKRNKVRTAHEYLRSGLDETLKYRGQAAHIPGWRELQASIDNGAPLCEDLAAFHHSSRYFFRSLKCSVKLWEREREQPVKHVVLVSHRCRIRGLLAAATPNFHGEADLESFDKALQVYENIALENLSLTRLVITDGEIDRTSRIVIPEINSTRSDK